MAVWPCVYAPLPLISPSAGGKFKGDEERKLTTRLVFEEIKERTQLKKPISDGALAADVAEERGGTFRWATYDEWMANSWKARVHTREAEVLGLSSAVEIKVDEKKKLRGMANPIGAVRQGKS